MRHDEHRVLGVDEAADAQPERRVEHRGVDPFAVELDEAILRVQARGRQVFPAQADRVVAHRPRQAGPPVARADTRRDVDVLDELVLFLRLVVPDDLDRLVLEPVGELALEQVARLEDVPVAVDHRDSGIGTRMRRHRATVFQNRGRIRCSEWNSRRSSASTTTWWSRRTSGRRGCRRSTASRAPG